MISLASSSPLAWGEPAYPESIGAATNVRAPLALLLHGRLYGHEVSGPHLCIAIYRFGKPILPSGERWICQGQLTTATSL